MCREGNSFTKLKSTIMDRRTETLKKAGETDKGKKKDFIKKKQMKRGKEEDKNSWETPKESKRVRE